jgi:predicted GIY-YIG superfamily endonuclease
MPAVAAHQFLLFPPVRPLTDRFGAAFFRAIPEAPGVYLMSSARDGVLYVGKAGNLRHRLGSYRASTSERAPRKLIRLLHRVERIDWDLCPDEPAACARERALIRALQPRFNTQGVRPPKTWFIGWRQGPDSLGLALGEALDDYPEVRGPFVFARPAFAALLRSLWRQAHPQRAGSVTEIPSPLLHETTPLRWTVPWSAPVARWLAALEHFLSSADLERSAKKDVEHPEAFPELGLDPTLLALPDASTPAPLSPPAPLCFETQWRAVDAECLHEFRVRLLRDVS